MRKGILSALLLLATTLWANPALAEGRCATLHEHANYSGAQLDVGDGDRLAYMGDFWNDRVSSISIGAGCQLEVWEHINYMGAYSWFNSDVPWIGDGWNDRISSYGCSCVPNPGVITGGPPLERPDQLLCV